MIHVFGVILFTGITLYVVRLEPFMAGRFGVLSYLLFRFSLFWWKFFWTRYKRNKEAKLKASVIEEDKL